jgi:SET domain-containing protein
MPFPDLDTLIASTQYHPNIEWRFIPGKGRGVFARRFLAKGTLVECSPISRFPASDFKHADYRECQALHHVFTWSAEPGREKAYGWGLLALYNHSPTPNVELTDGPIPDTGAMVALRDIQAGEELCCNYGYTWFEET